MTNYIINIGSNLGNRRLNLSRAVSRILAEFGSFEVSHVIESEPWGFKSHNKFLNICLMFKSDLPPKEVLSKLQEIEKSISTKTHRGVDGSYIDREIDIDIVAADDIIINSDSLTIPHKHLPERSFFLEPLQEIAPGWKHPVSGKNAEQMLAELPAHNNSDS